MPARPLILAVDVGTSGVKVALFDDRLRVRAQQAAACPVQRPKPGFVEVDPRHWWRLVTRSTRALLAAHDAARVEVVAFSTLYPAVVLVDERFRPLRPAILYCDARSAGEGRAFERRVGRKALLTRTGSAVHPGTPALSSLVWLAEHEPEVLRRARHLLQPNSYLVARLTGRVAMDLNTASVTGLLDVRATPRWWTALARRAGLDEAVLPPLVACHERIGGLTAAGARALGLRTGVPVVLGAGDSACAALAAGLLGPGAGTVACGSTDTVAVCTTEPILPEGLINVTHAVPGRYLSLATVSSAGLALEWIVRLLWGQTGDTTGGSVSAVLQRGLDEAGSVAPGAGGVIFLPYLQGERTPMWDADARGVFVGLSVDTGRAEAVRAVLEGIALALRHNVEALEAAVGKAGDTDRGCVSPVFPITLVGGGARGTLLNQIRADVLGRSVRVPFLKGRRGDTRDTNDGSMSEVSPQAATSLAGAAILGAVGVGLQPTFRAAVAALGRTAAVRVFRPRLRAARTYQRLFEVYVGLYPALRQSFAGLRTMPSVGVPRRST